MASDWQSSKLGDVIAVNPSRPLAKGSDSVYISMQQVETANRSVNEINHRAFKGSGARFQNGDTLLARITPCLENGKTAYVDFLDEKEVGHGSTEFIVLTGIKGVSDDLFVYYLARYPEFRNYAVVRMEGSSGRQRVPAPTLEKYTFACPSYDEQSAISHILGSLDDKIELNRRMNETLEATARAIFKSWFVDFDPVQAKAEGGDPGLPDDIAALFPDSFEDSELGEIPTGWKFEPIGQAVKCVGGSTPSTENPVFWEGGKNPFVTPKDMSSLTSPVILDTSRHITDAGVDKISSGRLPVGTVILSSRAPIGYLAITEVPVSINQGAIAMICNKDLPNHYVLYWTGHTWRPSKAMLVGLHLPRSASAILDRFQSLFLKNSFLMLLFSMLNLCTGKLSLTFKNQTLSPLFAILCFPNSFPANYVSRTLR